MSTLKIEKRAESLPSTLTANTLYVVKVGSGFDLYVSDSTGTSALPQNVATNENNDLEPFLTMGVAHG